VRVKRLSLFTLLLSLLVACEIHAEEWQEVSRNSELTIYTRHRSGSALEELRAIGELDAPAAKVHSTLADVANYPEFMPYTKESRFLSADNQLCYMLLSPPIVGARDYTIRVHRETQKDESGATTYYSHWQLANSEGPPPRPGVARVSINEGSWLLEPIGNRTKATYTLYTDGGGIPPLLVNFANKQSVSRLFEALRERVRIQK
jgi:polyketide cyclase/dehydrase/lipid transport protein